jgi:hypothetical protein
MTVIYIEKNKEKTEEHDKFPYLGQSFWRVCLSNFTYVMALGETKQPPERMEESDDGEESVGCVADRARLLDADLEPEQTDPVAVRAAIAPYLEEIDSYMRSLEVSEGLSIPLLAETWVRKSELVLAVGLRGLEFGVIVVRLVCRVVKARQRWIELGVIWGARDHVALMDFRDSGDWVVLWMNLHVVVQLQLLRLIGYRFGYYLVLATAGYTNGDIRTPCHSVPVSFPSLANDEFLLLNNTMLTSPA